MGDRRKAHTGSGRAGRRSHRQLTATVSDLHRESGSRTPCRNVFGMPFLLIGFLAALVSLIAFVKLLTSQKGQVVLQANPAETPVEAPLQIRDPQPERTETVDGESPPVMESRSSTRSGVVRPAMRIDRAIEHVSRLDELISRTKIELLDLQIAEQASAVQTAQTRRFAGAMASGWLKLHFPGDANDSSPQAILLAYVPPGSYQMGHSEEERRQGNRESAASHFDFSVPTHTVQIKSGFFIGIHEVSQGAIEQYRSATEAPRSKRAKESADDRDERKPAANITWHDAMQFCQWIGEYNRLYVRLPSEIEWEYAARGNRFLQAFENTRDLGVVIGGPYPVDDRTLDRGWCNTVAMRGNVQEWCTDGWDDDRYKQRVKTSDDGSSQVFDYFPYELQVEPDALLRSVRGASFRDVAANHDPALRRFKSADLGEETVGFRVVVPVPVDLLQPR